jgi:hypothetical protein
MGELHGAEVQIVAYPLRRRLRCAALTPTLQENQKNWVLNGTSSLSGLAALEIHLQRQSRTMAVDIAEIGGKLRHSFSFPQVLIEDFVTEEI